MGNYTSEKRISKVEITNDTLTGRGGLALFVRYLEQINIYSLILPLFGSLRKSKKGIPRWNLFKQIFCFFYDGTSRHLSYFDQLLKDRGYASVIENDPKQMASSHSVKRFFQSTTWLIGELFRTVLKKLFIWRLKIKQPSIIELMIDTMVMDNDEAKKRHGVQPTYKKVKGFQPLQIIWEGKIVDAIFRGGKKHSNHGNTVMNMVAELVLYIRTNYRANITIIVRMDSGFFDEVNLKMFDALDIGVICTGKMYKGVKNHVQAVTDREWPETEEPLQRYENGKQSWLFIEFGYRCDCWDRFYRAIYTEPEVEDDQFLLEFARPANVMVTNIGINENVLKHCTDEERDEWLRPETIIRSNHQRGADELAHRGLKDFGFEELPFKRFPPNSAFYYCMIITFFLFETFKEDVLIEVLPITSYASTVRRVALDFAGKIIRKGRECILKVTAAVMAGLNFERLWERCQNPVPILV